MDLQRRLREAAQLRELRDILSCAKSEQQALSQKAAKHHPHLGKVHEGTRSHLAILNVKDDQKMFQDNAFVAEAHATDCPLRAREEQDEDLDGWA